MVLATSFGVAGTRGSSMPLIWLCSSLCFLGQWLLHLQRLQVGQASILIAGSSKALALALASREAAKAHGLILMVAAWTAWLSCRTLSPQTST